MPQLFSLPSARRATFRAPDPAAAAALDFVADEPQDGDGSASDPVSSPAPEAGVRAPDADVPAPEAGVPSPEPGVPAAQDAPHSAPRGTRSRDVREPRHRADRVGNRRPSSSMRRIVALGCASMILGGSAFGAVAASADDDGATSAAPPASNTVDAQAAAAADELVSAIDDDSEPVITTGLSTAAAPFTGGAQVTVQGEHLDAVAGVTVGGTAASLVTVSADTVTFAVPAVDDAVRGDVEVVFTDATGQPIEIDAPVASSPAAVGAPAAVTGDLSGVFAASTDPLADAPTQDALTLTYTDDARITAQVDYVLTYWSSYNTVAYTVLSGVDCANFASQSLVARGWAMDGTWYYDGATGAMGPAWASSTALRDYLLTRTDVATALDDSQRDGVKVGDIAQFDWDSSGDRDHTAVVTRVEHTANGTKVWVGGHTKDADYWDVDEALASGGGSVSYFSLS